LCDESVREEGKTGSPRKALGGEFKLKGA